MNVIPVKENNEVIGNWIGHGENYEFHILPDFDEGDTFHDGLHGEVTHGSREDGSQFKQVLLWQELEYDSDRPVAQVTYDLVA